MDTVKIGKFLAQLRKEKKYTQEQLGERLGVTNKTISRWENGNYMPSVEMLQLLSCEYAVSINEILSGERLTEEEYPQKAEENIKSALRSSSFTLKERMDYWRTKWLRDNIFCIILAAVVLIAFFALGIIRKNGDFCLIATAGGFAEYIFFSNRMKAYVERKAFDGKISSEELNDGE